MRFVLTMLMRDKVFVVQQVSGAIRVLVGAASYRNIAGT